ncbi:MAG TPA: glycine betaine ABC transporter substrate-binding protein [Candidatus Limnocylindrales bacterium]|nr:glycine betaine ABC transporter substrate-binding protein [Candidatus Limnocylindrales bacterium]
MRHIRRAALGAAMLALVVSACSLGGGSQAPSGTIASQLILAGPPECPERPFCLEGLTETYGLTFKEFKPTDSGGPITIQALENGDAQVGLLFTSDPAIAVKDFVLLEDDKQLQLADNLIPVVRQDALDENPVIEEALNAVMAALSQEALTDLNKQVTVDGLAAADVAAAWIEAEGFAFSGGSGSVTVGSTNFYEQEILAEVFSQVLEAAGIDVERKFQLGAREVVFPALESGEIDILAEYAATALEHVNNKAGEATTDPVATAEKLRERLADRGLTALDHAVATDQNGFVVTRATADQYGLVKLSDLAKPVP